MKSTYIAARIMICPPTSEIGAITAPYLMRFSTKFVNVEQKIAINSKIDANYKEKTFSTMIAQ